ncbi:MAG: PQQ-dependent sugar dehydrogenase [Chromatiales bacterium]|nr:PQQ-dependent sugar dehydrogenase [Chromatiales bacterium]
MALIVTLTVLAGTAQSAQPIGLEQVVSGLSRPVGVRNAGDGSNRLFVVQQGGQIRIVADGQLLPSPFLDISALVSCCGERGLLGLAFHPDYAANGRFLVDYTDTTGATVVAEYRVSSTDPDAADPGSARVLLTFAQPFTNHNGGDIAFGPDGYLYIATGDGGSGGDPLGAGQDLTTLLGKILRIDVDGALPYAIPPGNPFVGQPSARAEIWAYGLRNPWRIAFDRLTGDLWIADVGQNQWEEVNLEPRGIAGGRNYGWNVMEGTHCFAPSSGCDQSGLVLPVIEYDHSLGCSVTGGYRYRGSALPQRAGTYLFADYCSGRIWGATPGPAGSWLTEQLLDTALGITSFGEDEAGELYLTHSAGGTGAVYRVANTAHCDVDLDAEVYTDGQVVTATRLRIANLGPAVAAVELKIKLDGAAGAIGAVNVGADGSLLLPSGFDQEGGPSPLFQVTPALPRGAYSLHCRMIDPTGGEIVVEDVAAFRLE